MKNLILVVALSLGASVSFAKRKAPAEIKPVVVDGNELSTQSEQSDCMTDKHCGQQVFLVSKNVQSGNVNWITELYQKSFNPKIETDVQTIFPKSLKVKKNKATVVDERGSKYVIDTVSGELITPLKSIIYPVKK